jgi:acyl-CoA thioesterase FadM
VELSVRFRKPIPLGEQLTVVGELVKRRGRLVEGEGELCLADDTVAATAKAKYIILADEQVESFRQQLGSWQVVPDEAPAEQ